MTKKQKWGIGILGFVALVAVLIALFDWNMLRPFINRKVSDATGRAFAIRGDLDVDWWGHWRRPLITVNDVILGNAAWSKQPAMAHVKQARAIIDVPSFFKKDEATLIPFVALSEPDLLLERNPKGEGNWVFKKSEKEGKPTKIAHLNIDRGQLVFRSPPDKTDVRVNLSTVASQNGGRTLLKIDGSGQVRGLPAKVDGEVGQVLSLEELKDQPYPIRLEGRVGKTSASASGTVLNPTEFEGLSVDFSLSGNSLADLYEVVGVPLPPTPQYSVKGHLTRKGMVWDLTEIDGRVGSSDVAGAFSIDRGQKPQFMRANLQSENLDLADLSGFIGGRTESGKPVTPKESDKVLPDQPFKLDKLNAANADIRFKGKRIKTEKLPLDDFTAHLILKSGNVTLDPLNFGIAGGDVTSTIGMNANGTPITTRADITVRRVDLGLLMPGVKGFEKANAGKLGGRAKFSTKGNSVAKMLGNADGNLAVVMDGGTVSDLILRLSNLDVARSVLILLVGDKPIPIRCMVTDLKATNGVMDVQTMILDTEKRIITGDGNIDFRDEKLDLKLKAEPKDISLIALRGPIELKGTFKDPKPRPELEKVAGRVGLAAILGAIAPPLALAPLVELGGGDDTNCGKLINQALTHSKKAPPAQKK